MTPVQPRTLARHEEDTVDAIGRLHAVHAAAASSPERWIARITRYTGTPAFVAILSILIVAWITINVGMAATGREPIDEAPFPWAQGMIGLTALYVVVLILTTQSRDDQLASLREQLTLELAILSEQKSAKIIALLEELRKDDPTLSNRPDTQARDLSKPADTGAVVDALKVTQPTDP